jgi:uncharacterized protein (TIRG00374 family)
MTTLAQRSTASPWKFGLKLAISLGLLGYLLARSDLQTISVLVRSLRLPLFIVSLFLYILAQLLSSLRWQCLLQAEKIHLPFWKLILLYFEGMFFNLMLPTLIGGDIVRGYHVFRLTRRHEASLASILVERLSGYVAMIMIACVAAILAYPFLRDPAVVWLTAASAAALIGVIAGLLSDQLQAVFFKLLRSAGLARFHETLHGLYEAIQRYWGHRRALLMAVGLSLILQSIGIFIFYLISRSLNFLVPLQYFFLFVPLIHVLSMIPISVAGIGVREASSVYFFAKVGLDSASAMSLSLLYFAVTALTSGLGGIVFLLGHSRQDVHP